jgi:thiol peroxidase
MASITLGGNPVNVQGTLPTPGEAAPTYSLVSADFEPIESSDFAGKNVVLNIFPTMDTGVCSASIRTFNERAADLDNTVVLCVSADLPIRAKNFCEAEGIENCVTASTFRSPEFAPAFGVAMTDGKWAGLAARAVVVVGPDGSVIHSQLVPEIAQEPDYDAALTALD